MRKRKACAFRHNHNGDIADSMLCLCVCEGVFNDNELSCFPRKLSTNANEGEREGKNEKNLFGKHLQLAQDALDLLCV